MFCFFYDVELLVLSVGGGFQALLSNLVVFVWLLWLICWFVVNVFCCFVVVALTSVGLPIS